MNTDIRVSTTFFSHRKTKKLQRSLGEHGVLCLLKLWTRVALEKPCGILEGWDKDDIEIESDFKGEPGTFVSALLELGFLDEADNVHILHNWDERQGWVSKSEERSEKARLSTLARTHKDIYKQLVNNGCKGITKKEYLSLTANDRIDNEPIIESITNGIDSLSPLPSPSPSP